MFISGFSTLDLRKAGTTMLATMLAACGGGGGGAPAPAGQNLPPTASAISRTADPAVPFVQQNLSASDPEGHALQYLLVSPADGTGYRDAYVDPAGVLYLTLTATDGVVTVQYRAS